MASQSNQNHPEIQRRARKGGQDFPKGVRQGTGKKQGGKKMGGRLEGKRPDDRRATPQASPLWDRTNLPSAFLELNFTYNR